MRRILHFIAIIMILFNDDAIGNQRRWVRLSIPIRDSHLTALASDPNNPNLLYIGSENNLYKSLDGLTWQIIFRSKGEERRINEIKVLEDATIYLATANGLYHSSDQGAIWKRVLKKGPFYRRNIKSIDIDKNGSLFYILTDAGLYKVSASFGSWEKVFFNAVDINESSNEGESLNEEYSILKRIAVDRNNNLYLSTNKGIFKSPDKGKTWQSINQLGLTNQDINFCLISETVDNKIYAATDSGVFEYDHKEDVWRNIHSGLKSARIKYLALNSKDKDSILCLTDNEIYKSIYEDKKLKSVYTGFNNEPSIREIQEVAIRYAEVHPDKINAWRKGAKLRGILPTVAFGIDNSVSDTYEIYTSSSTSYNVSGPKDYSGGWDLSFTWDLADLIYNEHQTSIDVRSKLMVQLREEILNEVTRLYFERRRLKMELATNKETLSESQALEKELRMDELTASIDAYTGGVFSDAIKSQK